MFEVSWIDPTAETVKQRKNRLAQQSTESHGLQQRATTSSESLAKKVRPSFLTLLNGSRKDSSRPTSRADGRPHPEEDVVRDVPKIRSGNAVNSVSPIQELPTGRLTFDNLTASFPVADNLAVRRNRKNYHPSGNELSPQTIIIDPKFATWASQSVSTDSNWSEHSSERSQFVQPLSPTSFVTQCTEITIALRDDLDDEEPVTYLSSKASSSAEALDVSRLPSSPSQGDLKVREFSPPVKNSSLTLANHFIAQSTDEYHIGNVTQVNRWKPPENWDCPPKEAIAPIVGLSKSVARPPWHPELNVDVIPPSDLSHLRRSLLRMQAANAKILLERLKEDWGDVTEEACRELEFEKKLWMHSALCGLVKKDASETYLKSYDTEFKSDLQLPQVVKKLSLYDDHAPATYISGCNPSAEIHHISIQPLSPASCPNIRPFSVPSPTAKLPFASTIFTSIHAFALPALLPSSSIPTLLKECHRTLLSSHCDAEKPGSLHLVLLDPSPSPLCTGPYLRAWLDNHVLLNLERQFRCTNPCRLFPLWLADAGFAVSNPDSAALEPASRGNTIKCVRFSATNEPALVSSCIRDAETAVANDWGAGIAGVIDETTEELKTVIGRMLWEEMWGSYCVEFGDGATRRWWDDRMVMEECARMGTTWDILVIEAIKEG